MNHKEMGIRKEIQKKAVLGWGDGWKGSQEANGAEGTRLRHTESEKGWEVKPREEGSHKAAVDSPGVLQRWISSG